MLHVAAFAAGALSVLLLLLLLAYAVALGAWMGTNSTVSTLVERNGELARQVTQRLSGKCYIKLTCKSFVIISPRFISESKDT